MLWQAFLKKHKQTTGENKGRTERFKNTTLKRLEILNMFPLTPCVVNADLYTVYTFRCSIMLLCLQPNMNRTGKEMSGIFQEITKILKGIWMFKKTFILLFAGEQIMTARLNVPRKSCSSFNFPLSKPFPPHELNRCSSTFIYSFIGTTTFPYNRPRIDYRKLVSILGCQSRH